jgi:hypothetical protein
VSNFLLCARKKGTVKRPTQLDIKKPFRNHETAVDQQPERKIGGTNGGEDLLVFARAAVEQSPALRQRVFGLKHDAKLWKDYAGQMVGNVTFLFRLFFKAFSAFVFWLTG